MKKLLLTLCVLVIGLSANAAVTADQALSYFSKYVDAANAYSEEIVSYYTKDAKIIRTVVLPKGGTQVVSANMKEYANQMRLGANLAKMKKYKNYYVDRKVTQSGNDFKISCSRKPSTGGDALPAYFIVGEDADGKLKIKEEMMYSKEQGLLKLMKNKS